MEPRLRIARLSALLVATQIGVASTPCRAGMVSRLGENRFVAFICTQPYGSRSPNEAPEQSAHFPALADP